jgi:predicted nucleic acid-binding protein
LSAYAESSAVLAWLLGEPDGRAVAEALSTADMVVASELTLVECDRCLIRAVMAGTLSETAAVDRRTILNRAATRWHLLGLDPTAMERARRPLPAEPVRTLDALHLAAALLARSAVPDLAVLSLDRRVRENARSLGFDVAP